MPRNKCTVLHVQIIVPTVLIIRKLHNITYKVTYCYISNDAMIQCYIQSYEDDTDMQILKKEKSLLYSFGDRVLFLMG